MEKHNDLAARTAAFLADLKRFVITEHTAQKDRVHRIWQKPLAERVNNGQAIQGVTIAGRRGGLIELRCFTNQSRFREGDILCLHQGDPSREPRLMVHLEYDAETTLLVSSQDPNLWRLMADETVPASGWILDFGFMDLSVFFLRSLDDAGARRIGRETILPLLMGNIENPIDPNRYAQAYDFGETEQLNEEQRHALATAYAAKTLALIQGPPGTGKTRVLACLVQLLVNDGERVLVTAFTHRAINHALNKIAEVHPLTPVYKIGQASRRDDLIVDSFENFTDCPVAESPTGYALGATPYATQTQRLAQVGFDSIVVDEASQMTLPMAIMGMLSGHKYIFIGDHKQLPPVVMTRDRQQPLQGSVFEWLDRHHEPVTLTTTYRLNDRLTRWPSDQFYYGELEADRSAAQRRLQLPSRPARWRRILDPEQPAVFWDLGHRNATIYSKQEAHAVVDLVTTLLDCGVAAAEIGVIAPFRSQGRLIRHLLKGPVADEMIRRQIIVDTVERMQGQERDVIIVSMTTSLPSFAEGIASFYFQPERLNVAITRPRTKLIIVGSSQVVRAQPADEWDQEAVMVLKGLLDSCTLVVGEQD